MSAAALAGRVAELLDGRGPVLVDGADAARWADALGAAGVEVAGEAGEVASAFAAFLGERGDADRRAEVLARLRARLGSDGRLVVLDHNQPRRWPGRVAALPWLWCHGVGTARARYPTAREIAAHGFEVELLRFAVGERVQLVVARPR